MDSADKALNEILAHYFTLINLDVQMPEINGYELADILYEEETTRHNPIISLTAIDQEIRGYESGALRFIYKSMKDNNILQDKARISLRIFRPQQKNYQK